MLERKHVLINNHIVRYFHTDGTGTPVVLLHGWRSEAKVWEPVAKFLAEKGYPCYALDLPGFGGSELPKTAFSVSDYAAVVLEFMAKNAISKAIVIGHSFGGRIGIVLAAEHAEKVEKLVLVDSGGIRNKSVGLGAKKVVAKIVKPLFKLPGTQNLRKKIYTQMGAEDYVATPLLKEIFVKIVNEDLQERLKKIAAPTLIVWGESDAETPLADGKRMHELIQNSQLEVINGAGHYSFVDAPDKFKELIISFLSQ